MAVALLLVGVLLSVAYCAVMNTDSTPEHLNRVNGRIQQLQRLAKVPGSSQRPKDPEKLNFPIHPRLDTPSEVLAHTVSVGNVNEVMQVLCCSDIVFSEAVLNHALGLAVRDRGLKSEHALIASYLLHYGADVDFITNSIRKNTGKTMLMVASERQNPEMIDVLIKAGANRNARDSKDRTALDWLNSTIKSPRYEQCKHILLNRLSGLTSEALIGN